MTLFIYAALFVVGILLPKRSSAEIKKDIEERTDAIQASQKEAKAAGKSSDRIKETGIPKPARPEKSALVKAIAGFIERIRGANAERRERNERDKKILKQREQATHGGPKKVVTWCKSQLGKTENPYGSNWGEPIATWIKWLGYSSPVPWCGCFAGYAIIAVGGAKGITSKIRLGFTPYIVADAKAGANGLKAVPVTSAQPGDLIVFDFDGGGADHVGVCVGATRDGMTECVEGNTSSSTGGSQANGGGVFLRRRPISQVAVCARPSY